LVFLGDCVSSFTLGVCRDFILYTLHHIHQPLVSFENVNSLVNYLLHLGLESMQENQLLGIFIFKGDHSQHVIEVLDVGGQ
jgi:hypothetical protein